MEEQDEINWPTPREWAAELRATSKGQTRKALRTRSNQSNCCLGILAEMAGAQPYGSVGFTINGEQVHSIMAFDPRPDWMSALDAGIPGSQVAEATLRNLVELRGHVERLEVVLAMALADRGVSVAVDR